MPSPTFPLAVCLHVKLFYMEYFMGFDSVSNPNRFYRHNTYSSFQSSNIDFRLFKCCCYTILSSTEYGLILSLKKGWLIPLLIREQFFSALLFLLIDLAHTPFPTAKTIGLLCYAPVEPSYPTWPQLACSTLLRLSSLTLPFSTVILL